ncbi:helix-turn-helix transcriptional regulator [Aeribacillus composti]|uniref:helix-turn-helix domain-containing protein n=1 Tax=Aeribacillus composti TaxID=1868734 RepID=UPI002E1DFE20|nr:helix-turn-helix transcriptional regulator [Aeribacillus composti]
MNKELLRFMRASKGMTQQELADLMGVTQSLIYAFESGRKPIAKHRVQQLRNIFTDDYIERCKRFLDG